MLFGMRSSRSRVAEFERFEVGPDGGRRLQRGAVFLLRQIFLQAIDRGFDGLQLFSGVLLRVRADLVERGFQLRDGVLGGFLLTRTGGQQCDRDQRDECSRMCAWLGLQRLPARCGERADYEPRAARATIRIRRHENTPCDGDGVAQTGSSRWAQNCGKPESMSSFWVLRCGSRRGGWGCSAS